MPSLPTSPWAYWLSSLGTASSLGYFSLIVFRATVDVVPAFFFVLSVSSMLKFWHDQQTSWLQLLQCAIGTYYINHGNCNVKLYPRPDKGLINLCRWAAGLCFGGISWDLLFKLWIRIIKEWSLIVLSHVSSCSDNFALKGLKIDLI